MAGGYDRLYGTVSSARIIGGIVAALLFFYAGNQMTNLRSVGGQSVAEAFYQAFGWFSYGVAVVALAWGISADREPTP